MNYPSKALDYFEELVFENWQSFLKEFFPDAWDLVSVRFASTGVEFVVILADGQHVVDGAPLSKFLAWCEGVGK